MCQNKDPLKRQPLKKIEKYKKNQFKLTRTIKANSYSNLFKLNLFKTWEGVQEFINITKIRKIEFSNIKFDNRTINKPTDTANAFNDHFTIIVEKIEQKIIKTKFSFSRYIRNPNEQYFLYKSNKCRRSTF